MMVMIIKGLPLLKKKGNKLLEKNKALSLFVVNWNVKFILIEKMSKSKH